MRHGERARWPRLDRPRASNPPAASTLEATDAQVPSAGGSSRLDRPALPCCASEADTIRSVFKLGEIAFGDSVRIVDTDLTRDSGHAGMVGVCYGLTTPSASGVDVIGRSSDDVALNINFGASGHGDAWFAPDLVVLVDRHAGAVATVGTKVFKKTKDGGWIEESEPQLRLVSRLRRLLGRS